jgi:hypothetical protein
MVGHAAVQEAFYIATYNTWPKTGTLNCHPVKASRMAMEIQQYCPSCDEDRTFWRVASTEVHLGEKVKYHCEECDHGFIEINGAVDTSASA